MSGKVYGPLVFLLGVLVSVLVGVAGLSYEWISAALVGLGVLVGLLNIDERETVPFLLASLVFLMFPASLKPVLELNQYAAMLQKVFDAMVVFVAPAAFVVSLKAIYDLAGEDVVEEIEEFVEGKKPRRRRRK